MTNEIPMYAADGQSLGFRTLAAAKRLIASGYASPVYGRKGHLKALHAKQPDGASSVTARPWSATRYSFRERLDNGTVAWRLRRLGKGSELRPIFLAVVRDCMSKA